MKNKLLIGVLSAATILGGAATVGAETDDREQILQEDKLISELRELESCLHDLDKKLSGIEIEIEKIKTECKNLLGKQIP